jgi:hypothetical protein
MAFLFGVFPLVDEPLHLVSARVEACWAKEAWTRRDYQQVSPRLKRKAQGRSNEPDGNRARI